MLVRFAIKIMSFLFFLSPDALLARQEDPLATGLRVDYTNACHVSVTCTQEVFLDLAFPLSNDGTARSTHLTKWTAPFSISFATTLQEKNAEIAGDIEWRLDNIVTTLSSAGIDVSWGSFPPSPDHQSLVVLGVDEPGSKLGDIFPTVADIPGIALAYEFAAQALNAENGSACRVSMAWDDAHQIVGAVVLLDLKQDMDAIEYCLTQMVSSAFGFLGEPSISGLESSLADDFLQDYVTHFDKLLLKILTDDFIQPGLTMAEVKEVFPEVYARHRSWQVNDTFRPEPVDRETLSCMASIDCAREHFLEMAVTGSSLEPKSLEQRFLIKVQIPTSIALIEGANLSAEQKKAAAKGYRDALALARALRMPIFPQKPHYPKSLARIRGYLSGDFEADREGAFASWIESDQQRRVYDQIWNKVKTKRTDKTIIVCRFRIDPYEQERYGTA